MFLLLRNIKMKYIHHKKKNKFKIPAKIYLRYKYPILSYFKNYELHYVVIYFYNIEFNKFLIIFISISNNIF